MKRDLKCCIEEALSVVDDISIINATTLKTVLSPCNAHNDDNNTSLVKQALLFFWKQTNEIQQSNQMDCRDLFCDVSTDRWPLVYIVVLALTMVIAIFGNIFAILVIFRSPTLRRRATYKFLMSLAVSDLLVSLSVIPIKIWTAWTNFNFCQHLTVCRLFNTTDHTFFTASVTHLFVVAIDRYISINHPYTYEFTVTLKRCKIVIAIVWCYALLWGVISNLNINTLDFKNTFSVAHFKCIRNDLMLPRILYSVVYFIPCGLMIYIYVSIWFIAVKQGNTIRKLARPSYFQEESPSSIRDANTPQTSNHTPTKMIRHRTSRFSQYLKNKKCFKVELKATKIILTVFGTFFFCWTPVTVMTFTYTFNAFPLNRVLYVLLCDFLPNLNSCLNPFIYCFFHREFNDGLRKIYYRLSFVTKHEMSLKRRRNDERILRTREEKLEETECEYLN